MSYLLINSTYCLPSFNSNTSCFWLEFLTMGSLFLSFVYISSSSNEFARRYRGILGELTRLTTAGDCEGELELLGLVSTNFKLRLVHQQPKLLPSGQLTL